MADYLLFENATGYALFDVVEAEDIGANLEKVQESVLELNRFGKMVKLKAFVPFKSAEEALANINDVTEGAPPPAPPPRLAAAPPRLLLCDAQSLGDAGASCGADWPGCLSQAS